MQDQDRKLLAVWLFSDAELARVARKQKLRRRILKFCFFVLSLTAMIVAVMAVMRFLGR